MVTQCFMKHLLVSMSVKQNLFISVFVHKCLMLLNDVVYTTFKMFVTQMSYYLFVISFQLMFHKTLCYRLAKPLLFAENDCETIFLVNTEDICDIFLYQCSQ